MEGRQDLREVGAGMTKKDKQIEMLLRALSDARMRAGDLYAESPEGSREEDALDTACMLISQAWNIIKDEARATGKPAFPIEGCTRCDCGCKYWDGNVCHSCGSKYRVEVPA